MINKKVLIITWCLTSLNYGELLQAYAMQSILKQFGFMPVTISYLDSSTRKFLLKNSIYNENIAGYFKFKRFIFKNMNKVLQLKTKAAVENICEDFDIYICGSDQIWNPNYDKTYDIYTLNFGGKDKKRIAYAPSIGIDKILDINRNAFDEISKNIKHIDFISVREESAKTLLEERIEKDIHVVLDPTLLVPRREWLNLSSKKKIKKRYILVYVLGNVERYARIIDAIADKYKVEQIIWLDVIKKNKLSGKRVKRIRMASPEDFLNYINQAAAVVTDSFHGLMFSVKFKKSFYILKRKYEKKSFAKDSRIEDILERLGLGERVVKSTFDIKKIAHDVSYKEVIPKLEMEQKESIAFFKKALV